MIRFQSYIKTSPKQRVWAIFIAVLTEKYTAFIDKHPCPHGIKLIHLGHENLYLKYSNSNYKMYRLLVFCPLFILQATQKKCRNYLKNG